jgi:hypothetical protein
VPIGAVVVNFWIASHFSRAEPPLGQILCRRCKDALVVWAHQPEAVSHYFQNFAFCSTFDFDSPEIIVVTFTFLFHRKEQQLTNDLIGG